MVLFDYDYVKVMLCFLSLLIVLNWFAFSSKHFGIRVVFIILESGILELQKFNDVVNDVGMTPGISTT